MINFVHLTAGSCRLREIFGYHPEGEGHFYQEDQFHLRLHHDHHRAQESRKGMKEC